MILVPLFLIALTVAVAAPLVFWWVKTPKGGWKVSTKLLGHCFSNGRTISPGHPFKAPVLKKPKKK